MFFCIPDNKDFFDNMVPYDKQLFDMILFYCNDNKYYYGGRMFRVDDEIFCVQYPFDPMSQSCVSKERSEIKMENYYQLSSVYEYDGQTPINFACKHSGMVQDIYSYLCGYVDAKGIDEWNAKTMPILK